MNRLSLNDVAESFGTDLTDLDVCKDLFHEMDFSYSLIKDNNKDQLMLNILKKIDSDEQIIGSPERTDVWQQGWQENLNSFNNNKDNLSSVVPKFVRPNQPIRFKQQYILPENTSFELDYIKLFQKWFFYKYMKPFENIYEFGCGSGINLVAIQSLFPDKNLIGSDFVDSPVNLINSIASHYNFRMKAFRFDIINPDYEFTIEPNSCVLTFGAIEQLAGKFEPFVDFLIDKKVDLCVHVEPTVERYDQTNLADYLAICFHRKRGYTIGFVPHLEKLHSEGKIDLIKVKRTFFGSLYMEGYTYIVWKPK